MGVRAVAGEAVEVIEGDDLFLLGYFTTFTHEPNIQVRINDERTIPVEIISFPQRDNFSLNFNYGFNHNFKVSIPIEDGIKIEFRVDDDISIPVQVLTGVS